MATYEGWPRGRGPLRYFGERKPNLCCGVYVIEKKLSKEKLGNLPKAALSGLIKCDKTFFPNIYILFKLLAVLPVSVATLERSFSSFRRSKTYLRNTNSKSRLNGLALLLVLIH